jgi:hypothetical protein
MQIGLRLAGLLFFSGSVVGQSASFYTQRLEDPKAVYVTPSGSGDDTAALQKAIDQVQEAGGQGIVMVGAGRYQIRDTIYIWPSIRLIGYGPERPVMVLATNAPGFTDASNEKVMFFFAGRRPRNRSADRSSIPDASPGTFYSALANIDLEIQDGNAGAVGVRARYAQHCFLAHMDLRLGLALAGIHEGGNVVEDVHFHGGTHAIGTSKPSPGWQFTLIDCSFEGQGQAAILEHEAGLTLIRPYFRDVPTAVEIEPGSVDELWVKDARLEDVSGPAFRFGMEKSPRNEINVEGAACRNVPCFAELEDSSKRLVAPSEIYQIKTFSHGLRFADAAGESEIKTQFDTETLQTLPKPVATDLAALPPGDRWVNVRDLGAKGDGKTDDTEALQQAIATHDTLYLPSGFYLVHDTLKLRPKTVLIGLHPGSTQIILPDGTPGYEGVGSPKALLESPKAGSNVVIGIGLYTSGNNPRAVGAVWKAGANSMMNDVRFLGGHGTPRSQGGRENPYNSNHTADPDPVRRWDSQYPSLWVTDGGGGTFLDIWTPSTFAQAGMVVSDTTTEGRAYQISSEHHVRNEVKVRNAAHWRFYALQTEEERGESGFALPISIESSEDLSFANFHAYRVISSFQPFPCAVRVSNSRNIRFRNVHCDSNSKASFDSTVCDQAQDVEIRQHEFAWLDISDRPASVSASGPEVEELAGGFFNISGGAVDSHGDFYFVDAHWQRVYRWDAASRRLAIVSDSPLEPVNLIVDEAGNLMVTSYAGDGLVYSLAPNGTVTLLKSQPISAQRPKSIYLPVSDWHVNRDVLSHPVAQFVSPDGTAALLCGQDFLDGATSWGIRSSGQIRSFGFGKATPNKPFYITDESQLRTWKADVNADGSLMNFKLFAEDGGESVTTDIRGKVYIAAGQIRVYEPTGKLAETIEVPERPIQLVFGGSDGKTLFIAARTSLYSIRIP